ncbi:TPA: prepilin peptidase-dependent protein [Klebsiella quasipneumoniae subsp. quasipneumoniae]|nr:prepilin peptidase-dependent protein [Klebsiella quasipneumoniae subsp. quasipneumoniae]
MSRRGFSLAEALIAMAIGSLLLIGACRFLPALQRHILRQGEQLALENELWQRVHAVGKHLQRAGYCRGACGGAGLELAADGECLIVRWDANSNGTWETSPAAQRLLTEGFAPELIVTLAARSARQAGLAAEVEQRVTGYNL